MAICDSSSSSFGHLGPASRIRPAMICIYPAVFIAFNQSLERKLIKLIVTHTKEIFTTTRDKKKIETA